MNITQALSFVFTKASFFSRSENYWINCLTPLEEDFPTLKVSVLEGLRDRHESIVIASSKELLGEDDIYVPRGVVASFDSSLSEEEIDKIQKIYGKSLLGFVDTSKPEALHRPLFKRILLECKILGTGGGPGEGQAHLGKVLEQNLLELQRVKKLHEKVVPLRQEQIKGISLYSKFAAGFSSGGEFFDIKKTNSEVAIIVTCAQSYVASSIVLGHFENFQKRGDLSKAGFELFLEELIDECRELELIERDNYELLQLDLLRLNLKTFQFEGFHFGNGCYYSNGKKILGENKLALNENSFEKAYYSGLLERGEKLVFASPGTIQNFAATNEAGLVDKLIVEQFDNGARELLNEVFFQLKKNNEEDFLKFDASVIYLEVDSNAFIQV
jgi:hypothetical protein